MNTSVEIPEEVLRRAMLASGTQAAQEAVLTALDEFVRRHDQRNLLPLLGTLDDFMMPEKLDELRSTESTRLL